MTKKIHFVGIGGSGISGVANLAREMGYEVTGCDLEENTAYSKNIYQGHDPGHIKNADLVVSSPALFFSKIKIEEIEMARKDGKLMTWQEFLGKILLKDKKVICVAGTHGKSTTTAMAGKLLIDNGFDPIVMVGAFVPEWNGNSRFGNGEYAVIEADEFNNNFLHYYPDVIVINNIEFDHPDFFKNEEAVKESFKKFVNNLKGQKILITEKDSLNKKFNLKILGEHNQKNANMVFVLGRKLGISDENIVRSIENFRGIGRRLELIADRSGIKVYDDYAHHPTAIKTTIDGLREEYPKAKILVINEPHGYKRTRAFLDNYKGVFDSADKVIIGPIFKARDEIDESITPELVAKASFHKNIIPADSPNKILEIYNLDFEIYNIVVVMGAGKSYLWARKIAKAISGQAGKIATIKFSDITSFRIGGEIKRYFEVKSEREIGEVVKFANQYNLPIFVIGDGTDILASDKNFDGVVVKYVDDNISIEDNGSVVADAGANWDKLVEEVVAGGFQGIENLSGIPGTVGASPIQNIGAYGTELSDTFVSLEAFDLVKGKIVTFSKADCAFGYRESVFKKNSYWQKYIITSVTLKLKQNKYGTANYESLSKYIKSKKPTIQEIREAVLKVRSEKLENSKVVGNAGSFFKSPVVNEEVFDSLRKKFPDIKFYESDKNFKVPAGWILEKAGWKGKEYKNVAVSSKHALILINKTGKASAKEVYDLSQKIIDDVYNKFGIKLEREVQLVNF